MYLPLSYPPLLFLDPVYGPTQGPLDPLHYGTAGPGSVSIKVASGVDLGGPRRSALRAPKVTRRRSVGEPIPIPIPPLCYIPPLVVTAGAPHPYRCFWEYPLPDPAANLSSAWVVLHPPVPDPGRYLLLQIKGRRPLNQLAGSYLAPGERRGGSPPTSQIKMKNFIKSIDDNLVLTSKVF